MIIREKDAEKEAVISAAKDICAAIRTAPKACGRDHLTTMILTEEDKDRLADAMEAYGKESGMDFFIRDAGNVRASTAVVMVAVKAQVRGLGEGCGYCGFKGCGELTKNGGVCAFDTIDLGIAIGSAVSMAADRRLDNRVLFSAGKTAMVKGFFDEPVVDALALPLAVSGKSVFFDRK